MAVNVVCTQAEASGFGTIVKTIVPPHPTSCASSRGASFESLSEPPKIRPPGSDLGKPQRRCAVDASRWLAPIRTLRQRSPAPPLTAHAARAAGSCSRRARSLYEVQQAAAAGDRAPLCSPRTERVQSPSSPVVNPDAPVGERATSFRHRSWRPRMPVCACQGAAGAGARARPVELRGADRVESSGASPPSLVA